MKYMLIDITTTEQIKVVAVAPMRPVQLMGRILKASGRQVIAPPVEGRSFSKLDKLQLQYLYWNTYQKRPTEDYAALIQECLSAIDSMPLDDTPLAELEASAAQLAPEEPKASPVPGTPAVRPRTAGATGKVWEIADDMYAKAGNKIPDRKAVIAACEAAGINPSTASTQYGKWKGSKLAGNGA